MESGTIEVVQGWRVDDGGYAELDGFDVLINGGFFHRYPNKWRAQFAARCIAAARTGSAA